MKQICILIPTYNEQEALPYLYERLNRITNQLTNYTFTFLFVNDGSTDDTLATIKKLKQQDYRVRFVNLSRNYGKEIAMIAGFDHACADATILLDADLQDPPEIIVQMLEYWECGYEDVYAKRISRKGETWFKKWSSKKYYEVLQKMATIDIPKDTGDFRLLDRKCVEALKEIRESQRYTKGLFSFVGFKKKEILFERDARVAGSTKWNYKKLFQLAIDGITSFSVAPLRLASIAGASILIITMLTLLFIFIESIFLGRAPTGTMGIITVILFLGGVQLISIGLLGEYIGRIFMETKNRPLYFVESHTEQVVYQDKSRKIG
ncbi:glycosyltransferase family 2 protein [Listeria booriae]|uniref:Glycosyltransferase family 2 protein n=1 Tax=Listeria booriae TaxID=1552123 RepID=A0A842AG72_9LIST|nr:glycosyltransferase family 2 protein [Listeria booriae]MBC1291029.1 glycosyltransferase family 2 protein [Listeria booriae]MBC1334816.1 glycosyltransferase family 2 protein [Listeria booriae]MBC1402675.1 glycosyltransferase family 2 protein [Listeria booriae]MBC1616919.1 glycosyltransferase family 2 protein [Listeria booriae]MBC1648574.1 glycosyltransferase family 2 protein [Listeria booriae]